MIPEICRATFQPLGDMVTVTRFDGFRETSFDVDYQALALMDAVDLFAKLYNMGRVDAMNNIGREISETRSNVSARYEPRL